MAILQATFKAGSYFQDAVINQVSKSNAVITKGQVVMLDPADSKWKTAATNATAKRFGVAIEDAAGADPMIKVCVGGMVGVVADGAIGPHHRVIPAATAGRVAQANEASAAFNTIVGSYVGRPNSSERDGIEFTAAAQGDVVIVELGLSGGRM